jgi:3-hydroxyacyl-CoA dehydrogenase
VAVLTMSRGRANALTPSLRQALADALERAVQQTEVVAVVLRGAGDVFSSGVDIAEYDTPLAEPWIGTLARQIETLPKPVVACLNGAALGAGFEIALAAHGRVARAGLRLAQPEISLGLVPGGGATQRLPRMLGAQAALEIMLSGRAIAPEDPRLRRIFDNLTDADPLDSALSLARRLAEDGRWTRSCDMERGFSDPDGYQKAVGTVFERLGSQNGAETDILRCVEAAQLLPFEQGLAFEQTVFEERVASPEARAIRHVYTAERRAGIHPGLERAIARDLRRVALIGEEVQLAQLAVFFLDQGRAVWLVSARSAMLIARVTAIYDAAVSRGRLTAAAGDAALSRLRDVRVEQALSVADLVLEAQGAEIGAARPQADAIWCVLDHIEAAQARATELGRPVPALRIYRPAHSSQLAEFAATEDTPAEVIASLVGCFTASGRSVLRSALRPGLLGHRVMLPGLCAALMLVAAGADPFETDRAANALGFGRGLLQTIQTEGAGTVLTRLQQIENGAPGPALALLDHMARSEANGFYVSGHEGMTRNPKVGLWLAEWREAQRGLPHLSPGVSLRDALHAALVNGAARMIDAREVTRVSDIDLCLVRGYGFARNKGGPLLQADLRGLLPLLRVTKRLVDVSDSLWQPAPLIEDMVKYGRRFY